MRFGWVPRFTEHLQLVLITINSSTINVSHTLQFTTAHQQQKQQQQQQQQCSHARLNLYTHFSWCSIFSCHASTLRGSSCTTVLAWPLTNPSPAQCRTAMHRISFAFGWLPTSSATHHYLGCVSSAVCSNIQPKVNPYFGPSVFQQRHSSFPYQSQCLPFLVLSWFPFWSLCFLQSYPTWSSCLRG